VIQAKSNGSAVVDIDGLHWLPRIAGGLLKLQIALLDGQGVLAHQEFEDRGGWETN